MQRTRPTDVLVVDLAEQSVEREAIPENWLDQYVGGKGLGARYLFRELGPGIDPLGPENVLIFMAGPLTGLTPREPRVSVVTKSPLTDRFLDSYTGGDFAARFAGSLGDAMGLLVREQASSPVSLVLEDGTVSFQDAKEYWGEPVDAMPSHFPDAGVATIGPAGERHVVYATIAADGGDHHAGRGGPGAVLGSKSVKAVAARNQAPSGLDDLRSKYEAAFHSSDRGGWTQASETAESVDFANEVGALATRGWQDSRFEGIEDIGIEAVLDSASDREMVSSSTPGGYRVTVDGADVSARGAMQMTFGAGLGIDDIEDVMRLGGLCDRLGLDVIGVGNAVAWAIRAGETGAIDFDGSFGDCRAAEAVIDAIANRSTELGSVLADGIDVAASFYDVGPLIPTVNGMSLPAYDPRAVPSMMLAYTTSDRGACHRRARPIETAVFDQSGWDPETQVSAVIESQDRTAVLWSLVVDDFLGVVFEDDYGAEWLDAVGYELGATDLEQVGERIWNLTRLFNVREGAGRSSDMLPEFFTDTEGDGGESTLEYDSTTHEDLLDRYYSRRGWDENGVPTRETVNRLGIADLVSGSWYEPG
ncbi:MAG: aldehyde ferredoxin oxidoreductase family protein [Halodesulfurarchaeum sp.]